MKSKRQPLTESSSDGGAVLRFLETKLASRVSLVVGSCHLVPVGRVCDRQTCVAFVKRFARSVHSTTIRITIYLASILSL